MHDIILGDTITFNINNLQGKGEVYHVDAKKPNAIVYHVYNGDKTGGFKVKAVDIVEVIKAKRGNHEEKTEPKSEQTADAKNANNDAKKASGSKK